MAENPQRYDVRVLTDESMEYFDGERWVVYPDVLDDELPSPPNAVTRGDDAKRSPDARRRDDRTP